MDKFRLNEKTRTVRAYNEDIVSQEDFDQLEIIKKLDYTVVLVPKKPREYKHIKIDMVKYLEDNIDKDIYNEFIDRVEKKQNFLNDLKIFFLSKNKALNKNLRDFKTDIFSTLI